MKIGLDPNVDLQDIPWSLGSALLRQSPVPKRYACESRARVEPLVTQGGPREDRPGSRAWPEVQGTTVVLRLVPAEFGAYQPS